VDVTEHLLFEGLNVLNNKTDEHSFKYHQLSLWSPRIFLLVLEKEGLF